MSRIDIPLINGNGIDFKKIKASFTSGLKYESTDNFTNGEEFEVTSQNITNGGYLTYLSIYPTSIFTTHADDASTLIHCCVGLEFNVYIDSERFQTIRLSFAKSGAPISATSLGPTRMSQYRYHFIAKETVVASRLDKVTSSAIFPTVINLIALGTGTNNRSSNNRIITREYSNILPCGITNISNGTYSVGVANSSHRATDASNVYGTIFPMVKINNNIRVTVKYLFFNNNSDSTNEASFGSVTYVTYLDWIPIE